MKKIALTILGFVSVGAVVYGAGVLGYLVGGPQYAARFAPGEALYTIAVLKQLRKGETEEAIELLEARVDSHIIDHSTFDADLAKWLDIMGPIYKLNSSQLMIKIAKYRADYPSEAADPEVREHINSHLRSYSQ